MDEAVINGANLFFAKQFGIDPNQGDTGKNQWLLGLVNSAPYVCVVATSFDVAFLLTPSRSCVAPSLVAGSPNLLIVGLVVEAPSSFAPSYLSLPAFGKVSPTHGNISSSRASSSD
jgi:hypothetical protein